MIPPQEPQALPHRLLGYDRSEVDGYVDLLLQGWKLTWQENQRLRRQLENLEQEASDYHFHREQVHQVLLMAQKTSDQLVEDARQQAEKIRQQGEQHLEESLKLLEQKKREVHQQIEQWLANSQEQYTVLSQRYEKGQQTWMCLLEDISALAKKSLDFVEEAKAAALPVPEPFATDQSWTVWQRHG